MLVVLVALLALPLGALAPSRADPAVHPPDVHSSLPHRAPANGASSDSAATIAAPALQPEILPRLQVIADVARRPAGAVLEPPDQPPR